MVHPDAVDGVEPVVRAAVSGVEGYGADTDDELVRLELLEEDINPGQRARERRDGGPAGMMPPMAGGVGAPGAAGARGAAGANTGGLPGGMPVLGAAGGGPSAGGVPHAPAVPGVGVPGVTGSAGSVPTLGGASGAGGAGLGSGGLGAASGTVAAGSGGADIGFGVNPATGRPWLPSDPGFAERFGSYDPKTGLWVNPVAGMAYDPRTGRWSHAGGVSSGGWPVGVGAGAGIGVGAGAGAGSGAFPPVNGGDVIPPGRVVGSAGATPGVSVPGGAGVPVPSAGSAPGLGQTSASGMGDVQTTTDDLRTTAAHWEDLSARMAAVKAKMEEGCTVSFGVINQPRTAFTSSTAMTSTQTGNTTGRYGETSSDLSGSALFYDEIEAVNAAAAERVR